MKFKMFLKVNLLNQIMIIMTAITTFAYIVTFLLRYQMFVRRRIEGNIQCAIFIRFEIVRQIYASSK
jgi:hypothetical protein